MKEHKLEYYYDEQLKNLLIQFLAVFRAVKVKSGKTNELDERFINVTVKNGSSDRVVAAIKGDNTQNKPIRLPIIAGTLVNISLEPSLRKGTGTERTQTVMPQGGQFPNDLKTVTQQMTIPYMANFEVNMFASSQEQHYEMLEQILILFDPTLEIQTSDDVLDWTRIRKLELTNINFEENPPGTDRRLIQTVLSFEAPIYLTAPALVRKNYIAEVKLRVGAVSNLNSVEDALVQLDQDGIEYDTLKSIKDIDLD